MSSNGKTVSEIPVIPARVLVVEDDHYLLEGIREILELDGYTVTIAGSGQAGLQALKDSETLPDLIVSDIMMPQMDGYEFFEQVRREDRWIGIPFVFLSAKTSDHDVRIGKILGADDYIKKPFSAEDLLVTVSSKLNRNRQLQALIASRVSDIKRRILTILNHEFRTPLTYIIAYADMLSRDAAKMSLEEVHEFLKGVNSGADRLRRLIENFILLVEIETGEMTTSYNFRKRVVKDYAKLTSDATRFLQPLIQEKRTKIEKDIDPEAPPVVADWDYFSSALSRLIDNAIKFSDHDAVIWVRFLKQDGGLMVEVEDTGRGIPEKELGNIFESFYQVNRQRYEDQGAGSGLAIVKGIAEVHGAQVGVRSVDGEGSTFWLYFPPSTD